MMTDIIADTLTRIRNATRVGHKFVIVRCTKKTRNIVYFLWKEGYVFSYETLTGGLKAREDILLVKLAYVRPATNTRERQRIKMRGYVERTRPRKGKKTSKKAEEVTRSKKGGKEESVGASPLRRENYLLKKLCVGKKVPLLKDLKRISKPGRRVYLPCRELPRYLSGSGTLVMSTTSGLLTDREACSKGVGGEVWFSVKTTLPLSKEERLAFLALMRG
jgi:small subunit ribosomal protein S8